MSGITRSHSRLPATPRKVNDFLELVRPYGLIELVKSGRVALAREPKGKPGTVAGRQLIQGG